MVNGAMLWRGRQSVNGERSVCDEKRRRGEKKGGESGVNRTDGVKKGESLGRRGARCGGDWGRAQSGSGRKGGAGEQKMVRYSVMVSGAMLWCGSQGANRERARWRRGSKKRRGTALWRAGQTGRGA